MQVSLPSSRLLLLRSEPCRQEFCQTKKFGKMKKYVCTVCGWIYDPAVGDPDNGVAPGTSFEDIPEEWVCPLCGVGKDDFEPTDE